MPPNLQHYSPPTPIETPPSGEWLEVARRRYPASMVRVKINLTGHAFPAKTIQNRFSQMPPLLRPYLEMEHDGNIIAIFQNEQVVKWATNYSQEQVRVAKPMLFSYLPADGWESVVAGWQITTQTKAATVTFSIHPYPSAPAIVIDAAPHVVPAYAEAAADGIFATPPLLLGHNTTCPFAHVRICLHEISVVPPATPEDLQNLWAGDFENRILGILTALGRPSMELLLHRIETAHIMEAMDDLAPSVLATYPPPSPQQPKRIELGREISQSTTAPLQKRHLRRPITVNVGYHQRPFSATMTLQFAPLLDTDEIIYETAVPMDILEHNAVNILFLFLSDKAGRVMNGCVQLVGFRATLLEITCSPPASTPLSHLATAALNEVLEKGETVIIETNSGLQ